MEYKSCQSKFTILPNIKQTFKMLPKTNKISLNLVTLLIVYVVDVCDSR